MGVLCVPGQVPRWHQDHAAVPAAAVHRKAVSKAAGQ
jgi:hypothetical protein